MFRSLVSIGLRSMPRILKVTAFTFGYYTMHSYSSKWRPAECFHISFKPTNKIGQILANVIRVEYEGQFVGYAFCFAHRYLVSTSPELLEEHNTRNYDLFLGERKIATKSKIIGTFQHLAFLEIENDLLQPMQSCEVPLVSPVQIIQKRTYLSIKQGYYVAKDGGFGILDGKGQIGSLVVHENGVAGIVTQIGRDCDRGFLRMICWKDLNNILAKIKKSFRLQLGISATSLIQRDGIMVVRISANSPLRGQIEMGDMIIKANENTVKTPQDFLRVLMTSEDEIKLVVEKQREGLRQVKIHI